jgi:hypothetical protein
MQRSTALRNVANLERTHSNLRKLSLCSVPEAASRHWLTAAKIVLRCRHSNDSLLFCHDEPLGGFCNRLGDSVFLVVKNSWHGMCIIILMNTLKTHVPCLGEDFSNFGVSRRKFLTMPDL